MSDLKIYIDLNPISKIIYTLKPDFQLSLRIEIGERVRSVTEIKCHIGHSWNKVYKDKSYFLFFHLSTQMLLVQIGI